MRQFSHEVRVAAPPAAVLDAFFNATALGEWWRASHSRCEPRPLGDYVISWAAIPPERDGAGGGTPESSHPDLVVDRHGELRGTVMEFRPGREFFVAEMFWTRDGATPVGPMALEASCAVEELATVLTVRYGAADDAAGWPLHCHELARMVPREMAALKAYLERLFANYTR
jgi:hypothetical protein